jgi:hypothetical protein
MNEEQQHDVEHYENNHVAPETDAALMDAALAPETDGGQTEVSD